MFLCKADIAISAAEVLPFDSSKRKLKTIPTSFRTPGKSPVSDVNDWKESVQGGICPADQAVLQSSSAHGNEFRWVCPKCKRMWDDQGMFKGYRAPSGASMEGPGAQPVDRYPMPPAELAKPKSAPRGRGSMSRQHFNALAEVLKSSMTEAKLTPRQRSVVVGAIAKTLARFSPAFDASRFSAAAGA